MIHAITPRIFTLEIHLLVEFAIAVFYTFQFGPINQFQKTKHARLPEIFKNNKEWRFVVKEQQVPYKCFSKLTNTVVCQHCHVVRYICMSKYISRTKDWI